MTQNKTIAAIAAEFDLSPRQIKRAVADYANSHSGTTPYVYNTTDTVTASFAKFVAARTTRAQRGPRE